jgi:hypothetical protein
MLDQDPGSCSFRYIVLPLARDEVDAYRRLQVRCSAADPRMKAVRSRLHARSDLVVEIGELAAAVKSTIKVDHVEERG